MKISVNDLEILRLSETQIKVIMNDIPIEIFHGDMCRRVEHALIHKYERCLERMKNEWIPKLQASGVKTIPLDGEEFAQLVFSQPNYKNRSEREMLNKIDT